MMKILLPSDGSELALDAVRHALRLVRGGLRASFVLVNVQDPTHLYEMMMAPDADALADASRDAGMNALAPAAGLLTAALVPFETEVVSGDAANMLIEAAERHECDAVIIGARGAGGLRNLLLGSVSQVVLHDAPLPVTIVKHAGRA